MAVAEVTVKRALTELKVTEVAPVKFVPLIVTLVPTGPLVGAKLVIVGGSTTVNALLLIAVPPAVVTLIGPVVTPAGTVARIAVAEVTVKRALTELKVTEVAPVKFVPLMVKLVPTGPLVGAKLAIVGGSTTVNALLLIAVPPAVVTLIGPVVTPAGTVARIAVAEVTVKLALTELKVTEVAPVKFVPLMVKLVPTGPLVGAKLAIVGGSTTVNALLLIAVPPAVVTLIGPVVTPAGTVARIAVAEVTVKLAIVGGSTTVNALLLIAVPPAVVTLIGPVVTPAGTVARIAVAEVTVKLALTELKVTEVAPVKFVPLMVKLVPTG